MAQANSVSGTDRINYLNIGLMLISCIVALYIPFELFLFAYAVLGPAHYLTEISWLHKRGYFTRGKHDFWLLGGLAVLLIASATWSSGSFGLTPQLRDIAIFTFLALGSALVLVLTAKTGARILGLAVVAALAFAAVNTAAFLMVFVATFVPTLIHVYLFTGFFMIYGALKERSRTGYLAVCIFLLCPVVCLLLDPRKYTPNAYVALSYFKNFGPLNMSLLGIDTPHTKSEAAAVALALLSGKGLAIMRFIAFAYTYHYLNWFSKTSIIKWHKVGWRRLEIVGGLWAASVGTYLYDYSLGYKVLFCLSLMHIYLEFPLNHISIMGTFREARSMFGRPLEPALSAATATAGTPTAAQSSATAARRAPARRSSS
jgi:hypothetical protein